MLERINRHRLTIFVSHRTLIRCATKMLSLFGTVEQQQQQPKSLSDRARRCRYSLRPPSIYAVTLQSGVLRFWSSVFGQCERMRSLARQQTHR